MKDVPFGFALVSFKGKLAKESWNWTVEKTKEVRQNMTLAMSKEAKAYG